MFRRLIFILAVVLTPAGAHALDRPGPRADYQAISSGDAVQDRLFYLFTLIQAQPDLAESLARDPALVALKAERRARLSAQADCLTRPACVAGGYLWTDADIDTVAKVFAARGQDRGWRERVAGPMRASGFFVRHQALDDADLLVVAWRDAALAMNHVVRVYGLGEAPRYPAIDAINFDVTTPTFAALIASLHNVTQEVADPSVQGPALRFSLGLLYVNAREDAARYAPARDPENAEAARFLRSVDFKKYRYASLLVLGDGPDTPESRLGSFGKLRVMTAARRWKDGLAPVLIVSGGNVHPANTPFNEAMEMRRELIERYGVPSEAILVEPHARHTTTNFRNAVRLMHRYGVPLDKESLVVTSESQSRYVEASTFKDRCVKELGYMPIIVGARLSPFDLAYRPVLDALQLDAQDPLDP